MIRILGVMFVSSFFAPTAVFAGEIREFSVPTLERLGNELAQASQIPDRGATSPARKQARQNAIGALQGKLFNIRYNYVVLSDPDGGGFLVYALGIPPGANEVVLAGHFRVTVSADGKTVERVDALSRSLLIIKKGEGLPAGYKSAGLYLGQLVSDKPVETLIYTNRLTGSPIVVFTSPQGRNWEIKNGKIKDTGKSAKQK